MAKKASSKKNGTITFLEATKAYVAHLQEIGKAEPTVRSYASDLALAVFHFGPDKAVGKFLTPHLSEFLNSEIFTRKRDGQPKAEASLTKSRRAVRQFFEWAVLQGHAERLPFAAK